MSDVVLVLLRRPETTPALLAAARHMADMLGSARITALAVREPAHLRGLEADTLIGEVETVLRDEQKENLRIDAIKAIFDRWASDQVGTSVAIAQWVDPEGGISAEVGNRGSRSDIIIAARPSDEDRAGRQAFRVALLGTGRPVLLVPPGDAHDPRPFGHRIAVAWRDEKQAIRALVPGLRCFAGAAEVHVLVGTRRGKTPPPMPPAIIEHGAAATLHVLPIGTGPFGQVLLATCHELGADLLVMGAYAHSPLREIMFGGVTRYMLEHADLPVFMRH
jgi:nucleotide-binding universal stress UspA family protein